MQFGLSKKKAKKIVKSVCEVNVHHHTKTCRKHNTDCRFCFPRLPSKYCIIAQESVNDKNEDKDVHVHAVRTLLSAVQDKLPDNSNKTRLPGAVPQLLL